MSGNFIGSKSFWNLMAWSWALLMVATIVSGEAWYVTAFCAVWLYIARNEVVKQEEPKA